MQAKTFYKQKAGSKLNKKPSISNVSLLNESESNIKKQQSIFGNSKISPVSKQNKTLILQKADIIKIAKPTAEIGEGLTGAPIIRINKRKKEANFSSMILGTNTEKDRVEADERAFPPYQERYSNNTRNHSQVNGKHQLDQTSTKLSQIDSYNIVRDSPLINKGKHSFSNARNSNISMQQPE